MNSVWHDVRYGLRMLVKSPGFTLAAVLILALGIGFNTTIFSLVNAVVLRPLPGVQEPDQLVEVFTGQTTHPYATSSYPDYVSYRDDNNVFSDLLTHDFVQLSLSGTSGPAELIFGEMVSGNYFSVLGVYPALGRTLTPDDDQTPGASPVAVISHGLWQRRFGSDPSLIGRSIILNGLGFTVVGVAPSDFVGTDLSFPREIWIPIMMQEQVRQGSKMLTQRGANWLKVIGRLKPGVSIAQAQSNLNGIAGQLAQAYPDTNQGRVVSLAPIDKIGITPDDQQAFVNTARIAMGVVALVLLIACANVASLLLARAAVRRKEIAIRLALGASRARLIRQLLTESIVLSLVGGGIGLLLAEFTRPLLLTLRFPYIDATTLNLGLDAKILSFTLFVSVFSGALFGLAPALQASKPDLVVTLKDDMRSRGTRKFDLLKVLVTLQIALSLVLLIAAGLFIRSLRYSQAIKPGFETETVLVAPLDLRLNGYNMAAGTALYRNLAEKINALPGVQSLSLTNIVPLSGSSTQSGIVIEGVQPPAGQKYITVDNNIIAPGYFDTMGISLLSGRDFTLQDIEGAPAAVIINAAMAQRYWPDQDAVGKQFSNAKGTKYQIVGVVANSQQGSLWSKPQSFYYVPVFQNYNPRMNLVVRATNNPRGLITALQNEIAVLDKNLPVTQIKTIHDQIEKMLEPQKTAASLSSAFGLLAVVLAVLGLYGVVAYSVSQRSREMGIRLALGAQQNEVVRLVVKQGMLPVIIGIPIGLVGALLSTRFLTNLLYGIGTTDPVSIIGSSILLIAVAFLASYIPAKRAAAVDPMVALRHE